MSSINPISNQDLQLDDIPNLDGDWDAWGRFAHTMNGYELQGGFKPCADLANGGEAKILTELRCASFFEARRERQSCDLSFACERLASAQLEAGKAIDVAIVALRLRHHALVQARRCGYWFEAFRLADRLGGKEVAGGVDQHHSLVAVHGLFFC